MAVPDFQALFVPVLKQCADGEERGMREVREGIAKALEIPVEDLEEMLPSGKQTVFANRVGWAGTYLRKAGLLEAGAGRGRYRITQTGLEYLGKYPDGFKVKELKGIPEFREFHTARKHSAEPAEAQDAELSDATPEEMIQQGYEILKRELADDLLTTLKSVSPGFFERIVVDVLVKMGYGGSVVDAGEAVGKSGDGGIDGVIKEDKLGLDIIYVQAKKWENTIHSPQVRDFVGALAGKKAKKGVFITTSSFSSGAREFAAGLESKIVLIDGDQLAQLMIENNVGVSAEASYEVKKMDTDYFEED